MIETAIPQLPVGARGSITAAGLRSAFVVVGAAVLFLLARGLVWARPVSLEDLDLLALGALPPLLYVAMAGGSGTARRCATLLAWGWVSSLLAYVALHATHRFDDLEEPVRAAFQAGLARYVAYGAIYSLLGVASAFAVGRAFSRTGLPASSFGALAVGSALNATYFGVALFMLPV